MSPNEYEVQAIREALRQTSLGLTLDDELRVAMEMVEALRKMDFRLTSGGKTPSHDD